MRDKARQFNIFSLLSIESTNINYNINMYPIKQIHLNNCVWFGPDPVNWELYLQLNVYKRTIFGKL